MGFNIAHNHLQLTCFILAVVGVSVAIIATGLRFVAVRRTRRRIGWEDWLSVLATLFFILYVIPLIYLLSVMNGKTKWTDAEVVRIKKAGYSMGPQFCAQQMFAKLSLLFLYYRLFHIQRSFVYCCWFLGIFQVSWSISTYLVHILECTPPAKLWNPKLHGSCINSAAFLAAGETPNSLVDFALIALAVWVVHSLKVKTSAKIKLFALFITGGLAGVLGFVKIGEGFSSVSKTKLELLDPIWAVVQQTCSVICCCAPVYKPILPNLGFLANLWSITSSKFSRTKNKNTFESKPPPPRDRTAPYPVVTEGKKARKPPSEDSIENEYE